MHRSRSAPHPSPPMTSPLSWLAVPNPRIRQSRLSGRDARGSAPQEHDDEPNSVVRDEARGLRGQAPFAIERHPVRRSPLDDARGGSVHDHRSRLRRRQRAGLATRRARHGPVPGALSPGGRDLLHPDRRRVLDPALGPRHPISPPERRPDRLGTVSDRLRHGSGRATGLRDRDHAAAGRGDRAGTSLRAHGGTVSRLHAQERAREGSRSLPQAGQGPPSDNAGRDRPRSGNPQPS